MSRIPRILVLALLAIVAAVVAWPAAAADAGTVQVVEAGRRGDDSRPDLRGVPGGEGATLGGRGRALR